MSIIGIQNVAVVLPCSDYGQFEGEFCPTTTLVKIEGSPGSKIPLEAQTRMYACYCLDLKPLRVCTSKQQVFSVLTRYATLIDMSAKCLISHIRVSDIVGYARLDENIAALGKIKADEGPIQAR